MRLPQRTLCRTLATLLLVTQFSGCRLLDRFKTTEPTSEVKAAPGPKQPLHYVAVVEGGAIRTHSTGTSSWLQEARDQLAYASGQLSEIGGLMDLGRVEVELDGAKVADDGGSTVVPFKARFPVSWNGEVAAPPALTLYLPKGGDREARQAFFTAYGNTCADPAAEDLALRVFWYHYRPSRPACDIGKETFDRSLVARARLLLTATPN